MTDQWYAVEGHGDEWSSSFEGPFPTADEALREYVEQNSPEDDAAITLTRGRDIVIPDMAWRIADQIGEATLCDVGYDGPDWPDWNEEEEKSFCETIDAAIRKWFDEHPKLKPSGWVGHGKTETLNGKDARERLSIPEES